MWQNCLAGAWLLIAMGDDMKHFKNILFIIDSELKETVALERAVSLAENNQAVLTVALLFNKHPGGYNKKIRGISITELEDCIIEKRRLQLESLVAPFSSRINVNTRVLTGIPFIALIREVLRHERDLVIKAEEKENIVDMLKGSMDMHILRKCPCPVWLMRSTRPDHYQKIMVAVKFDPYESNPANDVLNRQILEMSFSFALAELCELHIVHVWSAYAESSLRSGFLSRPQADVDAYVEEIRLQHQTMLDQLVAEFVNKTKNETEDYVKPTVHMVKGFAKYIIPDLVKENQIDLLMMGTIGRMGIPGFLMGNNAEAVLNYIDC